MNSPPLNNYVLFKGWDWDRIGPDRVRIWLDCTCDICDKLLQLHSFILLERNDAALNLSGLTMRPGAEAVADAHIPYAGGPRLCPEHYGAWLEKRIRSCDAKLEMPNDETQKTSC